MLGNLIELQFGAGSQLAFGGRIVDDIAVDRDGGPDQLCAQRERGQRTWLKKPFSLTKQPGFTFIAMTCFFLLYAPILILVAYSFNEGVNLAEWEGFSLRWYKSALAK